MNKTVWILWLQGWENAPLLTKRCVESWKHYNPNWNVVTLDCKSMLDYINIPDYIPGFDKSKIDKPGYADIFRTLLINKYGGVWADSTLYCNKPLDDWLPKETFLFYKPAVQHQIANWFISGGEDPYMMDAWAKKVIKIWDNNVSKNHYPKALGWHHRSFDNLYTSDIEFTKRWDATPKISCFSNSLKRPLRGEGPHYFTPYNRYFQDTISDEDKETIHSKIHPVYKLTHKTRLKVGSTVDYLLNSHTETTL